MNHFIRSSLSASSSSGPLRSPRKCRLLTSGSRSVSMTPGGRSFSAAQAATALRPFYFAVHPDLFGRYPDIRSTNENSLKLFNGYLDGLYGATAQRPTKSVQLKFYVRTKMPATTAATSSGQGAFRFDSVHVHLHDVNDPYTAVRKVLESCNLPTEHLPPPTTYKPGTLASDEYLREFWQRKRTREDGSSVAIEQRLKKLIAKADDLRRRHGIFETELNKKIDEMKSVYGLQDIHWQTGWTLSHCKGCLQTLKRILDTYRIPITTLSGWSIKFGRGIYVSIDGCVVLGVDDVPEDWCRILLNLMSKDFYFNDLPELEISLSKLMNDAQVNGWADESLTMYKSWLKLIIDKFRRQKSIIDETYPYLEKFRNLRLILVNDSTSLSLDARGKFLLPPSASPEAMWKFVIDNYDEAETRRNQYDRLSIDLARLKSICMEKLNLSDLTYDDSLNLESIKECIKKMCKSTEFKILNGQKVYLSRSYTVLPDGTVSIPVDN